MTAQPQRFVILPTRGIQATSPTSAKSLGDFLARFNSVRTFESARRFATAENMVVARPRFRVVDSIHEDGAKLVEMTPEAANALKALQPGIRIVPVVYFQTARHRPDVLSRARASAATLRTVVTVLSKADDRPVKDATVIAFTDFENRVGAKGQTSSQGVVRLALDDGATIERIYVYGPTGFWGGFRKNVAPGHAIAFALEPIRFDVPDVVRHYYGDGALTAGAGVKVGVVDTGVGDHPDVIVAGGLNTVEGEAENDFADNGSGHGTHVAGIVAARGATGAGSRGVAPGASIYSFRVFGRGAKNASNFAIAKAIDRAVAAGCDLINLSLGGGDADPATESAIHDARKAGTLVIAAAGNDDRSPVSFPAADPLCLAVSAMGRKGTFPKGSVETADVAAPYGTDPDEYVAAFSNVGGPIDLTGTGAGVVSTVPGGYAVMSGTSMACPAVTGFAARLLAATPAVLALPRTQERSDEMARVLLLAARTRGFGPEYEGSGLPVP